MQFNNNIFIKGLSAALLMIIVVVLFSTDSFAQQPIVDVGENTGCNNTEILLPITVENFNDLSAITIFIKVDTASVDFIDVADVNEILDGGDFTGGINYQEQIISLTWFSVTPVDIDSGLLCNMRILLKGGNAGFDLQENCEFIHSDLSVIENVELKDGNALNFSSSEIDPVSQSIIEGGQVNINVLDIPEGVSGKWQIQQSEEWVDLNNEPPYSGVFSFQLSVDPVTLDLNESLFRCMLSNEACEDASKESMLEVTPNGITVKEESSNILSVYPNPIKSNVNCIFYKDFRNAEIKVINTSGNLVLIKHIGNVEEGQKVLLNTAKLNDGLYILQLCEQGRIITSLEIIKR